MQEKLMKRAGIKGAHVIFPHAFELTVYNCCRSSVWFDGTPAERSGSRNICRQIRSKETFMNLSGDEPKLILTIAVRKCQTGT